MEAFGYQSKVGSGDTPPPSRKKKVKLQVPSKARAKGLPKWIPPEKRMRKYDESLPNSQQKWVQFMVVAPDQDTKEQLQAGFEYLHDNRFIDTDFMAVNSIVHSYIDDTLGDKGVISPIVVDKEFYRQLLQRACKHDGEHYFYDNIEFCKHCHKCLA